MRLTCSITMRSLTVDHADGLGPHRATRARVDRAARHLERPVGRHAVEVLTDLVDLHAEAGGDEPDRTAPTSRPARRVGRVAGFTSSGRPKPMSVIR